MERIVIRIERLLEAFEQAVIATSLDGTIRYWNSAAEQLYGWSRDEVLGRRVAEVVVPPEGQVDVRGVMERLRRRESWTGELPLMRRDGTRFLASVTDTPVFGDDGELIGVLGVSYDVSERRRAAAQLAASQERLRLALETARMGTFSWDLTTGVTVWDEQLERLFGVEPGTFGGTFDDWVALVHPDDRDAVLETVQHAMKTASEYRVEHRVILPDGSIRWIEGRGRAITDASGTATGALGVGIDITDAKRAEEALREESRLVETLYWVGGTLVAELDLDRIIAAVTDAVTAVCGAAVGLFVDVDGTIHTRAYHVDGLRPQAREAVYALDAAALAAADVAGIESRLVVPVTSRSGGRQGLLVLGHPDPGAFNERDERVASGIVAQAAIAIDNARLFQAVEQERLEAESTARRLARLHALAARLADARDVAEVSEVVVNEAATAVGASSVALCLVSPSGSVLELVQSTGIDPEVAQRFRRIPVEAAFPLTDSFRRGELVVLESVDERDRRYPALAGVATRNQSFAAIPLELEGRPTGVLTLGWREPRRFDDAERDLMLAVGRQSAQALGRARLLEAEREVARTLQRSLLPSGELRLPGFEVAARYHAFGEGIEVGGDFFDVFPAGPGRYGVVMGDVCGKGIGAASLNALARYTARAAAQTERTPSGVLRRVNDAMLDLGEAERFCTIAHLLVRPHDAGATVTVSCGGHPLPLLLSAAGELTPIGAVGTVVGVFAEPRLEDSEHELHPGDALILYTDGLVEVRSPEGAFAPDLLVGALRSLRPTSAEKVASAIEEAVLSFEGGHVRDDMALLVLRLSDG